MLFIAVVADRREREREEDGACFDDYKYINISLSCINPHAFVCVSEREIILLQYNGAHVYLYMYIVFLWVCL